MLQRDETLIIQLFQFLAGVVANLPGLSAGFSMGFSAILIPQLQKPDAEISATLEQGSWIGRISFRAAGSKILLSEIINIRNNLSLNR